MMMWGHARCVTRDSLQGSHCESSRRGELGPDVAGGWKSLLMTGGTDSAKKCALAGAKMRFAPTSAKLASTISCTKAWLAPYFGPVAGHLNEGPPVAP
jgi:hypothetical protein